MAGARQVNGFVISPIGEKDSVRRDHANKVFNTIIDAAQQHLKLQSVHLSLQRGDHRAGTDDVTVKVLNGILEDRIVIAVLTEGDPRIQNPNVYYELGIAHSAGRPVIVLKHALQPMPFDLKDVPYIEFTDSDLQGDAPVDDAPALKLAETIQSVLDQPKVQMPFRKAIPPLGAKGAHDRFNDSLTYKRFSHMLLSAEREIWIAGTTLWQLFQPDNRSFLLPDTSTGELNSKANIMELLIERVGQGVDVTVLLMHEDNLSLPPFGVDGPASETARLRLERTRLEIANSWRSLETARNHSATRNTNVSDAPNAHAPGKFRFRKILRGNLFQRVVLTEHKSFATPYFQHLFINGGPCVEADRGSGWYDALHNEVEYLFKANDEQRLRETDAPSHDAKNRGWFGKRT